MFYAFVDFVCLIIRCRLFQFIFFNILLYFILFITFFLKILTDGRGPMAETDCANFGPYNFF